MCYCDYCVKFPFWYVHILTPVCLKNYMNYLRFAVFFCCGDVGNHSNEHPIDLLQWLQGNHTIVLVNQNDPHKFTSYYITTKRHSTAKPFILSGYTLLWLPLVWHEMIFLNQLSFAWKWIYIYSLYISNHKMPESKYHIWNEYLFPVFYS